MNFDILNQQRLFQGFFALDKVTIEHSGFNGDSIRIDREIFERGTAAAVLPYDPVLDRVVMIEQFRAAAYQGMSINQPQTPRDNNNPWLMELIAGIRDSNESGEDLVQREALEEANLQIKELIFINKFWVSPGGSSETTELFLAIIDSSQAESGIFGLPEEGEDIKVHVLDFAAAMRLIEPGGRATNTAAIIALQWLALNKNRFQK